MSGAGETMLRTVTFGELEAGVWGAAVATGHDPAVIVAGAAGLTVTGRATVHGAGSDEEWRIDGDALELSVSAAGDAVAGSGHDAGQEGFDQLCRVTGRLTVGDTEHEVASLGVRAARNGALAPKGYAALREVAAWFEPGDGLALAAFRPEGAKGQDADVISAAVLDPESLSAVDDPRLSTTYATDGWAARAGLELWLGDDEDQPLLRRAAGEAVGARGSATDGGLELRAELFRWHSSGREGAGVYLVTSRR